MRNKKQALRLLSALLLTVFSLSMFAGAALAEEAAVDSYAWQGLSEMPKCAYLDALCGNTYYRVFDYYVAGNCVEKTEAVDGIDTFSDDTTGKLYYLNGVVISVNDNSKVYVKQDLSAVADAARESMEKYIREGTNIYGRVFSKTGKEAVPFYSLNGDRAEYDYYEYVTENKNEAGETTGKLTERFYIKDGDVFAIYKLAETGGQQVEIVEVIKTMTPDIPAGVLEMPNLTGYKEYVGKQ